MSRVGETGRADPALGDDLGRPSHGRRSLPGRRRPWRWETFRLLGLSRREAEVLALVSRGHTNADIARLLVSCRGAGASRAAGVL